MQPRRGTEQGRDVNPGRPDRYQSRDHARGDCVGESGMLNNRKLQSWERRIVRRCTSEAATVDKLLHVKRNAIYERLTFAQLLLRRVPSVLQSEAAQ